MPAADECSHECHVLELGYVTVGCGHSLMLGVLTGGRGLPGEARLVHLQVDGFNQSDVSWDPVPQRDVDRVPGH